MVGNDLKENNNSWNDGIISNEYEVKGKPCDLGWYNKYYGDCLGGTHCGNGYVTFPNYTDKPQIFSVEFDFKPETLLSVTELF